MSYIIMADALDKLTIKGFKSIQKLEDFELADLNVLIGGNGAGKSNFTDFPYVAGNDGIALAGSCKCKFAELYR